MASSVVKTKSLSVNGIEFLLFMAILFDFKAKSMPAGKERDVCDAVSC